MTCEKFIGLIAKPGIDAGQLPACTGALNLDELTGRLLDWWRLYPEKAENDVVRSVAYALRALKDRTLPRFPSLSPQHGGL